MRNSSRPDVSPSSRWVTSPSMRKTYSSGVHSTENTWYSLGPVVAELLDVGQPAADGLLLAVLVEEVGEARQAALGVVVAEVLHDVDLGAAAFGPPVCCPPTACIQNAACWPRADCVRIRAAA